MVWYRVSRTCPILVYMAPVERAPAPSRTSPSTAPPSSRPTPQTKAGRDMAVAANTPIELVNGVYERLAERVGHRP